MGQNFSSEPIVEKETERDHNDVFSVAVSSCQGWRMSQEDDHSLMITLPGDHKASFFAVFDGHGSSKVSRHASESLWMHLVRNDQYKKGNFKQALEESFLTFDREVNESYNAQLAGTTAVCILIVENTIYCANIGDSRGVASVNCECHPLSQDHKPEKPDELRRILAAGGYVLGNRVNGNLALSRAFGDFHYKSNSELPPHEQIVSPCPDVTTLPLTDDVDFLLLACDGIWDVLTSEEVTEFVISRLEKNMEPGLICEQLTTRCLASDYELVIGCDNMTVLLICYTRGRSWLEFCNNIFDKNTERLGAGPRVRHTAGVITEPYTGANADSVETNADTTESTNMKTNSEKNEGTATDTKAKKDTDIEKEIAMETKVDTKVESEIDSALNSEQNEPKLKPQEQENDEAGAAASNDHDRTLCEQIDEDTTKLKPKQEPKNKGEDKDVVDKVADLFRKI